MDDGCEYFPTKTEKGKKKREMALGKKIHIHRRNVPARRKKASARDRGKLNVLENKDQLLKRKFFSV